MTEAEAVQLIARYKNTWRSGPHPNELRTHLADMDAGTLGTILVRLARNEEHPPSIARLWAEYRAIHTTATDALPCSDCDSTGWITSHTDQAGYRYAKPCHCTHGNHARGLNMNRSW